MAEEDKSSKTEEPTARKLEKAREEGQVPVSQEVKTWFMFLAALGIVGLILGWMTSRLGGILQKFIERPHSFGADGPALRVMATDLLLDVGLVMAVPLGMAVLIGIIANLVQVGLLFTPKKIQPKWSNISPLAGFKRQFSSRSLMEFLKGVLKIVIVGAIGAALVWPMMANVELLAGMDLWGMLAYLRDTVLVLIGAVLGVMTFIAIADWAYQRYKHGEDQRMTKQEVRDEHKQQEGDPMVKGRLRQLRMEKSRQRMMQAVPTADVVVMNPTHYAVAMKYDLDKMNAPVVVAKGLDLVALRIRKLAEENDVTVVENPPLARALYAAVEIDQEIPAEHYRAVAEVIGYVMRLKGKLDH
ncbi:flagellar biosynthesis protein FlhB [Telmatospirillum sp. J64-1]|uniref:flagellar biosynthesis protein FlhB n=1 Tax=Telmatospirillum sp. J64-1 TaxID=2502183 RepID=UPI00115DFC7F|nr:flagellar biosynthesis protein FlhB [Telmatospirillum sp. J64-1]